MSIGWRSSRFFPGTAWILPPPGPSRGGQAIKVYALTAVAGRPFALILTTGNDSDITVAPALLARGPDARYVLAGKGYDADALRSSLRQAGAVPVIPCRSNRRRPVVYDKTRCKVRHRVENAFCLIKDFRRVDTRYDKLAANSYGAQQSQCLWRSDYE